MVACSVDKEGFVTIYENGQEHRVKLDALQKQKWKGNNRRTDYWFRFNGLHYHAIGSESATIYRARIVKG